MHARRKKKLTLILGGGGISTSYVVGFLSALKKHYKIKPDIIIAGSGSTATASYFVSGQFEMGVKKVWLDKILDKQFISGPGLFKYVDIDFLVDGVIKKSPKLNVEKMRKSKTTLLVSSVNAKTGRLQYFSSKEKKFDWFEVLRAGNALPIFYNKSISIGRSTYHDSHLSAVPETHVKKAKELGATHIISVHSTSEIVRIESSVIETIWFLFKKNRAFRKQYEAILSIQEGASETNLPIFPSQKPFANLLNPNYEDIVDTIKLGFRDAKHNQNLKEVLKDFLNKH